VNLKVSFTEMYPRILWELVEDPLGFDSWSTLWKPRRQYNNYFRS